MAAGGTDAHPETTPRARAARRNAPPRADVLAAAMATIAERGLDGLTMAGLGREVGMSSGHLLYYFRSKDELLLQTLEWSEASLGERRRALLSRPGPAVDRIRAYVDLYVPTAPRDPHWSLWLEVWNRCQDAGPAERARQSAIEGAWHRDLVALLAEGASRGELRAGDSDRIAARLRALLDGFSIQLAVGLPGVDRADILAHANEYLTEAIGP
ncbi:TetR/AcrR family transcriptional regulator [Streptomyces sp. BI20]|uniref:TetR/AcrR family transcriptional regulator n=1 Tax=Streptomyces sp. BI20 TaxID=3403460 RepID=UPI003C7311F7